MGRLDSATCGQKIRALLMQTVQDNMFVVRQPYLPTFPALLWLQKRRISVEFLRLPNQWDIQFNDYLTIKGSFVRKVDMNYYAGVSTEPQNYDERLAAVIVNCRNLEVLQNVSAQRITTSFMLKLRQSCPKLGSLSIVGGRMHHKANAAIQSLVHGGYAQLQHLSILPDYGNIVTDTTLTCIALNYPHLRTFELSDCNNVTSQGIATLAKCCTKLTVLHLPACRNVEDEGIESVAVNCQFLQRLNVERNIGDTTITRVIKCCQYLTYLCIDGEQLSSRVTMLLRSTGIELRLGR